MHINITDEVKKTSHRCRLNNKKRRRRKKKGKISVSRISDFKTAPPHINQVLSNRKHESQSTCTRKTKNTTSTTSASSDTSSPPQVEIHRLPPVSCLLCYTRSLFILKKKTSCSGSRCCGVSGLFLIQHFAERSSAVRAFCLDCREEDLPVLVTVLESRAAGNTLRRRLH